MIKGGAINKCEAVASVLPVPLPSTLVFASQMDDYALQLPEPNYLKGARVHLISRRWASFSEKEGPLRTVAQGPSCCAYGLQRVIVGSFAVIFSGPSLLRAGSLIVR